MYSLLKKCKKTRLKEWADRVKFFTSGWLLALLFFYVMRQVGVSGSDYRHIILSRIIFLLPVFTILSGVVFGSLHYFFEKYLIKQIPLWKLMLRLCIDQVLIIFGLIAIVYASSVMMENNLITFWDFIKSPEAIVYYLYVFIVNTALSIIFEIISLLGRANFLKLVTGKFYTPKEEYRIFMFIDLNASTTISEKLGHIAYSNFIKDCFYDLAVVHDYGSQIYQYVGDEAVLTWEVSKLKSIIQCIDAFWAYNDALLKRSNYYKNTYDIIPEFKAGMSIGMVTVVEIGYSKKEVAYHGNTLNTASRIEGLCNIYSEKLLISKKLYIELIKEKSSYIFEKVAETRLRGKENMTEIYSANKTVKIIAEPVS
jgi:adenylate cyclase